MQTIGSLGSEAAAVSGHSHRHGKKANQSTDNGKLLREPLKDDTKWIWSPAQQKAFQRSKEILSSLATSYDGWLQPEPGKHC